MTNVAGVRLDNSRQTCNSELEQHSISAQGGRLQPVQKSSHAYFSLYQSPLTLTSTGSNITRKKKKGKIFKKTDRKLTSLPCRKKQSNWLEMLQQNNSKIIYTRFKQASIKLYRISLKVQSVSRGWSDPIWSRFSASDRPWWLTTAYPLTSETWLHGAGVEAVFAVDELDGVTQLIKP